VVTPASAAGALTPAWTSSLTTTGATSASYTYTFTAATTSSLNSITMTVPSGTAGTLSVGTVTPAVVAAGGTVSLAAATLTYSFTAATVAAGTAVSVQISGITNTATAGAYGSVVTTKNGVTSVDSGSSTTVTLTATALTSPTWSTSSTALGASGVSYTYTFTTASTSLALTSVTMVVPPGTGGTPTLGTVTPTNLSLLGMTLSGTTLTYSFAGLLITSGTHFSIQVNGLTNTSSAGAYRSEIVTNTLAPVDSATTGSVAFVGSVALTSPSSLSWAATLSGSNQSAVDSVSADQQFTVADVTASGAGWHINVSATTLTSDIHTLPNTGTLLFTGSLTSPLGTTGPTATCVGSCTLPTNTTTYPVAIVTAAASPPTATVYDTAAGGGLGTITIGGHSSANPVGWWVNIPGSTFAGSYTSTVTVTIVSGP
jgi:hypothetical protein